MLKGRKLDYQEETIIEGENFGGIGFEHIKGFQWFLLVRSAKFNNSFHMYLLAHTWMPAYLEMGMRVSELVTSLL